MRSPVRSLGLVMLVAAAPAWAQAPAPPDTGLPLTPARWARFTASKGTWMSLDVSPDGQTIAFDLLGDLYTLPIGGGTATRLTHGIAHDMQPRFSPDGKRIVFVSDRSGDENLWLLTLGAEAPRPLTTGVDAAFLSPEWTPDGNYVVVSKGTPFGLEKIWLYHVKGGRGLEMAGGLGGLRLLGPAFGPNARYVWFAQRNGAWQYNAVLPQYQLGVYDREAGTRTTMSNQYGSAFRPALSPDGNGWRTGRGTTPKPASGCGSWPRGKSAGWPIPFSGTSRNPWPTWTCCRATRSCPTRRRWSCRTAARSGGCRWTAPPRPGSRSRRRPRWRWAPR
jgi:Tol biopolymer transport system component